MKGTGQHQGHIHVDKYIHMSGYRKHRKVEKKRLRKGKKIYTNVSVKYTSRLSDQEMRLDRVRKKRKTYGLVIG